jgi:ferredoxin
LFDEHDELGGNLRYAVDPSRLPRDVLEAEIALVRELGANFEYPVQVGKVVSVAELARQFDAVLLAVGEVDTAKATAMGMPMLGKGLKTDKRTMLTPTPGVFATGAAVTPYRHAVRAVGDGRTAAASIDAFLRGRAPASESQFTVRLGVLSEAELAVFRADATTDDRPQPPAIGLSDVQASTESARCLQCQCAKQNTCSLRKYSAAYDASPSEFKLERRPFTRVCNHAAVVYEQGKCISCGLCVQIATRAAEPLGLTFVGRGFDVRVAVPFDHSLSEALQHTAEECAKACPTGALVVKPRT